MMTSLKTFEDIRYLVSDSLPENDVVHGFFTRHGGVSDTPWDRLNLGRSVGDNPQHVAENRRRLLRSIGSSDSNVFDVWQVHSVSVIVAEKPNELGCVPQRADAIITDKPGILLMMRFADCVPILLYDPIRRVIGIVHAGWLGSVGKIVKITIEKMQSQFKSNPADVLAVIGPSIAAHHYPVGDDVIVRVMNAYGEKASELLSIENSNKQFDLWKANQFCLTEAGVNRIEVLGVCTVCSHTDWYSHRGDHGKTGRFGVVIGLR